MDEQAAAAVAAVAGGDVGHHRSAVQCNASSATPFGNDKRKLKSSSVGFRRKYGGAGPGGGGGVAG